MALNEFPARKQPQAMEDDEMDQYEMDIFLKEFLNICFFDSPRKKLSSNKPWPRKGLKEIAPTVLYRVKNDGAKEIEYSVMNI